MSKELRRGYVKQLRALARDLDVSQVRDDSGREKVQELFQSLVTAAKKTKKPELKQKAEKVFELYESTWKVEGTGLAKEAEVAKPVRLRGKMKVYD